MSGNPLLLIYETVNTHEMIIYNQTSTFKKYAGGIAMGVLIIPAILLIIEGFIFFGIVLIILYLAFETFRTGVDFNISESKITDFREVLFIIKIRKKVSKRLDTFSHYRIKEGTDEQTIVANYVQNSTVSQEHHTLELLNKQTGEFSEIVKSGLDRIQPLLIELEAHGIVSEDQKIRITGFQDLGN